MQSHFEQRRGCKVSEDDISRSLCRVWEVQRPGFQLDKQVTQNMTELLWFAETLSKELLSQGSGLLDISTDSIQVRGPSMVLEIVSSRDLEPGRD